MYELFKLSVFCNFIIVVGSILLWAYTKVVSGKAANFREGLKLVWEDAKELLGMASAKPPQIKNIEKEYLTDLTAILKSHLDFLIFKHAKYDDTLFSIIYQFQHCNIEIDVVERIFEAFIRDFFNLEPSAHVCVYARTRGQFLQLYYALSSKGEQKLRMELKRRDSRLNPPHDRDDLVE